MLLRPHAERDDFRKLDPRHVRVVRLTSLAAWLAPWVETPRIGLG
jgi:hypothetical protein